GVIVSRLAGINLSAQQNIDNQNELNAQTDVVITSQGNLTNTSTIQATHGDAILTVKGDVDNQQTIYSGQHLSMTTNGQLYNSGLLYGGETARFDVMQQLNNDGKILAAQSATLRAASITNHGILGAGLDAQANWQAKSQLTIHSDGLLDNEGQLFAGEWLRIKAKQAIFTRSELDAQHLSINALSALSFKDSTVVAGNDLTLTTQGDMHHSASHLTAAVLSLKAANLTQDGDSELSAESLSMTINGTLHNNGLINGETVSVH